MEAILEIPNNEEQRIAKTFVTTIGAKSRRFIKGRSGNVRLKIQNEKEYFNIPTKAISILFEILSNMAEGKSITLIPSDATISTQHAADMLNVSRPHIVKLLETGVIPFRKVGSHRRIELNDIVQYEKKLKAVKEKNMSILAKQAQDLNLGY
jgi:excisionase family DNA binding protein